MRLKTLSRKQKLWASAAACVLLIGVIALWPLRARRSRRHYLPLKLKWLKSNRRTYPSMANGLATTEGMVNADIRAQVAGYLLKHELRRWLLRHKGTAVVRDRPETLSGLARTSQGENWPRPRANSGRPLLSSRRTRRRSDRTRPKSRRNQAQLAQAVANQLKSQLDVDKYRTAQGAEGRHAAGSGQCCPS
jgi:hypothetical protein